MHWDCVLITRIEMHTSFILYDRTGGNLTPHSVLEGLRSLSLAESVTLFFASSFIMTALSAIFLGERVGWLRWTAIAVGFAGVVIVTRPAGTFQIAALFPVGASLSYSNWNCYDVGVSAAWQLALSHAYRRAPVSLVAPFEYTALVWAVLLDLFLFGLPPDQITFAGSAIIVSSGLLIAY